MEQQDLVLASLEEAEFIELLKGYVDCEKIDKRFGQAKVAKDLYNAFIEGCDNNPEEEVVDIISFVKSFVELTEDEVEEHMLFLENPEAPVIVFGKNYLAPRS